MTTTTQYGLMDQAAKELDDYAGKVLDAEPDKADATAALTEQHRQLGLDFEAVQRFAGEEALRILDIFGPADILLDPQASIAAIWQGAFLVGVRTQQLAGGD